jgi:hypothetical protein
VGAHIDDEARRTIWRALADGRDANTVAAEVGHNWRTVRDERRRLIKAGAEALLAGEEPEEAEPTPAVERREARDAAYWQRRAKLIERELADAEHVAEQLAGVRGQAIAIPDWLHADRSSRGGKSVVGIFLSDVHAGEVIDPEEILGINAFDPEICAARLKRYFEAAITIAPRWASDTECVGAYLALGGDLISGDIHDELVRTNALTAHEQVEFAVAHIGAGIRLIAKAFGTVHVVSVPGNHGRTTHKPTAKLYSRLSYDTLIASMLADQFKGDARVTFQYGKSPDQITPIFGRSVLLTHGDKLGTGGGMGFAGPLLPIVRGTKKVAAQQASVGRHADLILHGHFHHSANPGNVLSNGSVPGYSEYAGVIRASVEAPQQWLFLMHSRWGLRERMPIVLEDPAVPEKPRVRIPAAMSERAA